jgi:hypothetical protein
VYPHTDTPLRAMPITTKEEAATYMDAYKNWIVANCATGNGAFIGAKSKPATVRAPDLVQKAQIAEELAEMKYWQMPFEKASRVYYGIPYAKWAGERVKRGLVVTQQPGA